VTKSVFDTPSNAKNGDRLFDDQAEAELPAGHVVPRDAVGDWLIGLAKVGVLRRSGTGGPRRASQRPKPAIILRANRCSAEDLRRWSWDGD
jgi:hypothetical protein